MVARRRVLILSLSKDARRRSQLEKSVRFTTNFGELRAEFSGFTARSYGKQKRHSNPFRGGFFAL